MALAANIPFRHYAPNAESSRHVRRRDEEAIVTEMKDYIFAQYQNKTTVFRCQILPLTKYKDMYPPCRAREDAVMRQLDCEREAIVPYAEAKCHCDEGSYSRQREIIDLEVECAQLRGCEPEVVERIRCDMSWVVAAYQDGCGKYLPRIRNETGEMYRVDLDELDEMPPFDPEKNYFKGVPDTCTDTSQASWGKKTKITVDENGARVEELDSAGSSTVRKSWGLKGIAVLGLFASSILSNVLL